VDIDRITDADWRAALPRLTGARAVVFDLRGYPRGISYLFHFAAEGVIDSAQWHIPTPEKPDRVDLTFRRDPGWNLIPVEPYLRAKKVFLTDGRAISFAESVMGVIEAYKFAEIVGSTTAGTNGNINVFNVPGGFRLVFTGMKVLKQDGSRHHGVGIAPTIPLSRTRAGVAAGKDEVLLGGIEAARQP
jgi:C-terminal processing protease CtpA/Prc